MRKPVWLLLYPRGSRVRHKATKTLSLKTTQVSSNQEAPALDTVLLLQASECHYSIQSPMWLPLPET